MLERPERARRVSLSLTELLAAARLAGDAPLPLNLADTTPRLASRLDAAASVDEHLAAARAGAAEGGPAEDSLTQRRLLTPAGLTPELQLALRHLAGARGSLVVDVRRGDLAVRTWLAVEGRLAARLSSGDAQSFELGWFDLRRWHDEVDRIARLPGSADPSAVPTVEQALTRQQFLTAAWQPAATDSAILRGVHGCLRVFARRRGIGEERPQVMVWVLSHSHWYEVRPSSRGSVRLLPRVAADLGALTAPFARAQTDRAAQPGGDDDEAR